MRLAIRLARRELRRRPWRTALVILMVMVPTAGMTLGVTMLATSAWSAVDETEANWGQTDATGRWHDQGTPSTPGREPLTSLHASLPAGSTVVVEHTLQDRVVRGDRRAYLSLRDLHLGAPIARGRVHEVDGRLARRADEVVISDGLADALDVGPGDRIHPQRLDRELTVVGVATFRGTERILAYVGQPIDPASLRHSPGALDPVVLLDLPGRPFLDGDADPMTHPLLADPPAGWQIDPVGAWVDEDSTGEALFGTYVAGGVALVVLGTVITAAFAISARRQLHTVGLLSASGASPRTVRRLLVAQGALTGAVGAAVGIALAIAGVHLVPNRRLGTLVGHHVDAPVVPWLQLLPILLIGALVAAAASAIPARSAAQVSTLQALAGRRPLPVVPGRVPLAGLVALLAGAAFFAMAVSGARGNGSSLWALVAVAGALLTLTSVCLLAPWFVAHLERGTGRWPQSWRLAARSLARNRVRSSAVVGAICAVAAVLVAGTTLWAIEDADRCCRDSLPYVAANHVVVEAIVETETSVDPDGTGPLASEPSYGSALAAVPDDVVAAVSAILPEAQRIEVPDPVAGESRRSGFLPWAAWVGPTVDDPGAAPVVGIATADLLDLFEVSDDLRRSLARGDAVAVAGVPDGTQGVRIADSEIRLAGVVESEQAAGILPQVLVSERTAVDAGLTAGGGPGLQLWVADGPLTRSQRDALERLRDDLWWERDGSPALVAAAEGAEPTTNLAVPDPPPLDEALVRAAVLAAAVVLVLAVVAVGLALAANDNEDERQVLTAVGAPPRTLRRVSALRAVLLVCLGVALALPAGLLPAAAIHAAAEGDAVETGGFEVDPVSLGFLVIALPVIAGTVVWLAGWLRDAVRPARPHVFAFVD